MTSEANEFASRMVLGDYHPRGSLRIPQAAGLDPDNVVDGTKYLMQSIAKQDLVVPPNYEGLKGEDARASYIRGLHLGATWVADGNEKGAVLIGPDNRPVWVNQNGKRVMLRYNWDTLDRLGKTSRAEAQERRFQELQSK